MSYCHFSSDGFQSDVYVYLSNSGWVTHVAAKHQTPLGDHQPPQLEGNSADELIKYWRALDIWCNSGEGTEWRWEPVPKPYANATFTYDSSGECAAHLEKMRMAGVYVPAGVIKALQDEHEDER